MSKNVLWRWLRALQSRHILPSLGTMHPEKSSLHFDQLGCFSKGKHKALAWLGIIGIFSLTCIQDMPRQGSVDCQPFNVFRADTIGEATAVVVEVTCGYDLAGY